MRVDPLLSPAAPTGSAPQAAEQLEQAFIEEMLKYVVPQDTSGPFSGGAGQQQFSSFLQREWAGLISQRIDLGFGRMFGGS